MVGDGGVRDEIAAMEAALKMTPEEATLMRSDPNAPDEFVAAVPCFHLYIEALKILSRSELPTLRQFDVQKGVMLSMDSTMRLGEVSELLYRLGMT